MARTLENGYTVFMARTMQTMNCFMARTMDYELFLGLGLLWRMANKVLWLGYRESYGVLFSIF